MTHKYKCNKEKNIFTALPPLIRSESRTNFTPFTHLTSITPSSCLSRCQFKTLTHTHTFCEVLSFFSACYSEHCENYFLPGFDLSDLSCLRVVLFSFALFCLPDSLTSCLSKSHISFHLLLICDSFFFLPTVKSHS